MLDAVQQTGGLRGAWRWFTGDWLLENGFYRPITSISIALDYALYGETAWGFRLTNWLVMLLTAVGVRYLVLLYIRLQEVPRVEGLAAATALVFSLQQTGLTAWVAKWSAWWFVGAVLVAGLVQRHFSKPQTPLDDAARHNAAIGRAFDKPTLWAWLFAIGALFWGLDRALETHYGRLITWVPSRTALLGTLFSVWAIYCLLRGVEARRWGWLGLSGLLYLLALGSYEQPIMLAPLVGALVIWQRRRWGAWGWKALGVFALVALLIVTLRLSLLPTEPTRYQRQQLRSSLAGPLNTYLVELVPPLGQWQYWQSVGAHLEVLLVDKQGWNHIVGTLLYLGVVVAVWCWRRLLGSALAWHALTFLPMAFLHFFEHYMYLPQVGKTLFDVALAGWGMQQVWVQRPCLFAKEPSRAQANAGAHQQV